MLSFSFVTITLPRGTSSFLIYSFVSFSKVVKINCITLPITCTRRGRTYSVYRIEFSRTFYVHKCNIYFYILLLILNQPRNVLVFTLEDHFWNFQVVFGVIIKKMINDKKKKIPNGEITTSQFFQN